nr:MAG TPA: DNA-binding regulatory protein [Caudoviricetes sp.]
MDLQARYNRLKEQNRMLIEEARRYEKQIEELQSKIGKLAELNQKAFEVNIELSHKLLTYDKLDQVKRLPLHEGKNENR